MRRFHVFFILQIILYFSAAYSCRYGCVWSDTLNFLDTKTGMITGIDGNVTMLSTNSETGILSPQQFDIDQIHENLHYLINDSSKLSAIADEANVVVAGVTLIVKLDANHYEAFYKILKGPKENDDNKLIFVNGSIKKDLALAKGYTAISVKDFDPSLNMESFKNRLFKNFEQKNTSIQEKSPIEQQQVLENHFESVQEEMSKYYDELISDINNTAVSQKITQQINELNASVKIPDVQKMSEYLSFINKLSSIKFNFNTQIDLLQKSVTDHNNTMYGSLIDSEQYLLQFLNKEFTPKSKPSLPRLIYEYELLKSRYVMQKENFLKQSKLFDKSTQTVELEKVKNSTDIGYIFHLHSTREICRNCAFSISQDLLKGENAHIKAIKKILSSENLNQQQATNIEQIQMQQIDEPFFVVLSSCSKKLTSQMRTGIEDNDKVPELAYENNRKKVNIDYINTTKVFLQKSFAKTTD